MSDEPSFAAPAFIWKADDGNVTEIDPFHIRAWGINKQPVEGKPAWLVWIDLGSPTVYLQRFTDPKPAHEELERIRNAKRVN